MALLRRDDQLPAFVVRTDETPPRRYSLTVRQVRRALRRRRLLLRPVLLWRRINAVTIEGFPAPFEGEQNRQAQLDGRTLSGQLVGTKAALDRGQGLDIYSDTLAAASPENPAGFSGGPVLRRGTRRVVGVISGAQPGRASASDRAARGGSIYAVRVTDILREFAALRWTVVLAPAGAAALVLIVMATVATAASIFLKPGEPLALPLPSPTAISPTTQLPGCNINLPDSVPVKTGEAMFVTSTHGPGNQIHLENQGNYAEQPFAATAPLLTSVEVAAAYNGAAQHNLYFEIFDKQGRRLWSSIATVDLNSSNGMVPADTQPHRLPVTVGHIYILRVTNESATDITLFSHSLANDDQVQLGQPGCVLNQISPRPHPTPSGQYLAARILGDLQ